jgi:hypothetical protein
MIRSFLRREAIQSIPYCTIRARVEVKRSDEWHGEEVRAGARSVWWEKIR